MSEILSFTPWVRCVFSAEKLSRILEHEPDDLTDGYSSPLDLELQRCQMKSKRIPDAARRLGRHVRLS